MSKSIFAIGVLLVSQICCAEPYDFRGVQLGTPLGDFKKLPYPESVDDPKTSAQLVCTGEMQEHGMDRMPVSTGEQKFGAIDCAWWWPPRYLHKYQFSWQRAYVGVGDGGSYAVTYRFVPETDGAEPRLFKIVIGMNTKFFSSLIDALSNKYGSPRVTEQEELQNRMGAKFSSTFVEWDNGESSLWVKERLGTVDQMGAAFVHTALQKIYDEHEASVKPRPKL